MKQQSLEAVERGVTYTTGASRTHSQPLMTRYSKPNTHHSGITLVALVVTIIVLLILSSVTISSLLGDDGIIKKAQEVSQLTKKIQTIESVQLDILMAQLEGNLTQEKLEEILGNYGEVQKDEEGNITGLKPEGLEEVIPIEDLLTGEVSEGGSEAPDSPDTTAPTATISLNTTNTTPNAEIEATVTFTDNQSGVSIENCKYIFNTTSGNLEITNLLWNTAESFETNPQTIILTAAEEGTYYLHVLIVDVAGNKAETTSEEIVIDKGGITAEDIAEETLTNPETYYGKTVTGYTCDNSSAVANWRIFYAGNDFSTDGYHIYLIADYYIPYESIPKTTSGASLTKGISSHTAYWNTNVLNAYIGSGSISNSEIKKLNNDYFYTKSLSSVANNMKAVAYMLDATVWSGYKGENADYAVGGPSIEMVMKSYSQKNKVDFRAQAANATGYQVSNNGGASWSAAVRSMLSTSDSLYVLTDRTGAYGYWVSSPSSWGSYGVMLVGSNGYVDAYESEYGMWASGWSSSESSYYEDHNIGFRPLVRLNSNVKLEPTVEGFAIIEDES